jgi:hypothetical protein
MAKAILGSTYGTRPNRQGIQQANYDYSYPENGSGQRMNLKPGSKLHDKLRDMIIERAMHSAGYMSNRFDSWNKIDEVLTAYVEADDAEKAVQDKDDRKPVSIVFPNTYAILETMISYMMTAFFTKPVWTFEGVGPEDTVGSIMMTHVIQQHVERHKMELNLHTQFRDGLAYGIGAVHPYWRVTRGAKPVVRQEQQFDDFGLPGGMEEIIEFSENQVIYEGNALQNIDPYLMLPDPNVAINEIQSGEFFGWVNQTNLMNILSEEETDEDMFNARYLKHCGIGTSSIVNYDQSSRGKKSGMAKDRSEELYTSPIDVITMYVKLIPEDWDLGDGEYPEIWMFELGADEVILKAQPANYMHGMIPVSACAPEFSGYEIAPISRLEIQYGLQGVLDWLFNSHIANVRKALNDMLVVDPYMVNINDLKNPGPGKLIRLRKPVWGRGVRDAVQQLQVGDVTRGHMSDAGFVLQMMQQLSGSDQQMMGNLRQGGPDRLTSAEFQGTRAAGLSRLERVARLVSLQTMHDTGRMFATNIQQLMDERTYIKTAGKWPEQIEREYGIQPGEPLAVDPRDLVIDYDVKIRDGSIPGGNFSDSWIQLFQVIGGNEQLSQQFDMVRIFKHIARNLGAKNVEDFERLPQQPMEMQPQVMPDETVAREVERGNLVDVGEL